MNKKNKQRIRAEKYLGGYFWSGASMRERMEETGDVVRFVKLASGQVVRYDCKARTKRIGERAYRRYNADLVALGYGIAVMKVKTP